MTTPPPPEPRGVRRPRNPTHALFGIAARFPAGLRRFVAARFDRKSELGLRLTINVLVFVAAVWAFSGLLDAVLDRETLVRWDLAVNAWFHVHATPAGLATFNAITMVGYPGVWIVVAIGIIWLWARHDHFLAVAWLATNAGGGIVQMVLKSSVHRSRPQYAAAFLHGQSYSFPSGHTMASTICYTMVAFIIGTLARWPARRRATLYAASSALVLLIGFSRLYLGVHYPSDVFGGLVAGLAWLAACIGALQVVRNRWLPTLPTGTAAPERGS
jgi:membrane-associated phospholipid phosphatase